MKIKYKRFLDIYNLLKLKSFFLLGPRQTGKSFLIKETLLEQSSYIDLLKNQFYLPLSQDVSNLKNFIDPAKPYVVIDEIQRIPDLLNEVHALIEETELHFLLTGSSARKLRKKGVNLLGGRARKQLFHPLTSLEITDFNLDKYLLYGGLPAVYCSDNPAEELDDYIDLYLKEEIRSEGIVRNLSSFSRFLEVAALSNGKSINYTSLSSDAGMPASTVRDYFNILEDTLVGFMLPTFRKTKKRKAITSPKFYFFDIGVANYLQGIKSISPKTVLYGDAFEHFIIMEIKAYLNYSRIKEELTYWRSISKDEVDLLIGTKIALEIKSTSKISTKHLKGLKKLKEENIFQQFFIISHDQAFQSDDGVKNYHWATFLEDLWSGNILRQ